MRGMMPIIAFAIAGTWGLMVLSGLAGVAYGGYWLVTSESVGRSRSNNYSSPQSSSNRPMNLASPKIRPSTPNIPDVPDFRPSTPNIPDFGTPRPLPSGRPGTGLPSTPQPPSFNPPTPDFPRVGSGPGELPPGIPRPGAGNRPSFTPPPRPGQPVQGLDVTSNSNKLFKQFQGQLTVQASSEWPTWPARNAVDGNPQSSWMPTVSPNSREGSWIIVSLPEEVTLQRLTILGNRDAGRRVPDSRQIRVDLLSSSDKVLSSHIKTPSKGPDFDLPNLNASEVRHIRVTIMEDGNGRKGLGQLAAIGEIQAE